MTKFYYQVLEHSPAGSYREIFTTRKEYCDIAKLCAEKYFYTCGGYDDYTWPLTFILFDEDLNKLGSYKVDFELNPQFTVLELEAKDNA